MQNVLTPCPFSIHAGCMKALKHKSASIPNSRWLAYATAGAASAFACAHSAEGTIHYSGPINQVIRRTDRVTFQLDQPGDYIRLSDRTGTFYEPYFQFGVGGLAGASIVGFLTTFGWPFASHLKRGQLVSSGPFIPAQTASLVAQYIGLRGTSYIGFKFNNGSGDQYGWVRIRTHRRFQQNFKLIDYAWGDVGDRIRAGQTSSNEVVPEEGSLGWLAIGAAGLLVARQGSSFNRSQTSREPVLW
jgi:hypothetical protein